MVGTNGANERIKMLNKDRKLVCGIVDAKGMIWSLSWGRYLDMELSHDAWMRFFEEGGRCRLPLEESIKAYESVGYKAVFFTLTEMSAAEAEKDLK